MYYQKVNKASRKEMVDFLENHFRYDTMSSWNCSTSYANRVKIWNLGLSKELRDKFWDMWELHNDNDFYNFDIPDFINDFREKWCYDVGFNGSNNGYLVLYDAEKITKNGKTHWSVHPGRSIDQYEDFNDKDEWPLSKLKNRVKLVQAFDKLCDDIRSGFINYLTYY